MRIKFKAAIETVHRLLVFAFRPKFLTLHEPCIGLLQRDKITQSARGKGIGGCMGECA